MKTITEIKEIALIKNPWTVETKAGLPLVFSPLLKRYPSLIHAFTTRQGGQSPPPLDSFNIGMPRQSTQELRQDVETNRAKLCQSLDIPFEQLILPEKQIHSANVVLVETKHEAGEVDGIATDKAGNPIIIQCADCVPVIIYDPEKNIICMVHAGWRGTAEGICEEAVRLLIKTRNSNPAQLVSAIGPAIGSCCYPVGLEVVIKLARKLTDQQVLTEIEAELNHSKISDAKASEEQLKNKQLHERTHKLLDKLGLSGFFNFGGEQIHVDLKAINAYQLLGMGVSKIDVTDFCTSCRSDLFYSFRRSYLHNLGKTGHHGAIACLV